MGTVYSKIDVERRCKKLAEMNVPVGEIRNIEKIFQFLEEKKKSPLLREIKDILSRLEEYMQSLIDNFIVGGIDADEREVGVSEDVLFWYLYRHLVPSREKYFNVHRKDLFSLAKPDDFIDVINLGNQAIRDEFDLEYLPENYWEATKKLEEEYLS